MLDTFYIVCANEKSDFWQIRLRDNHFVMSAVTGFDNAVATLKRLVLRYRSEGAMQSYIEALEEPPRKPTEADLALFHKYADYYEGIVRTAVKEALQEVKSLPALIIKRKVEQKEVEPNEEESQIKPINRLIKVNLKRILVAKT